MKRIIGVVILLAGAICAQAAAPDKKDDAAHATAPPAGIPKGAVHNPDGTYNYMDKQGDRWVYRPSPFGWMKSAYTEPVDPSAKAPETSTAKATDEGDVVRFERNSPFGPVKWERKKSELTDEERRILDAQNAKQNAKPEPETAKPDAK